ncbi:MAG: prepilin-type N-terminal cleavage/methylation domain-containing protein [Pseudomonadota bacterium]
MTFTQPARQHGVTLVETLIAIAILAMIIATMAPILQMTLATTSRTQSSQGLAEEGRTAAQALRRAFGGMIVPKGTKGEVSFTGRRRELRFSSYDSAGHIQKLHLFTDYHPDNMSLVLSVNEEATSDEGETVVLHDRLEDVSLAYYGAMADGAPLAWRNQWSATQLPRLIRLTVVRRVRGERREDVSYFHIPIAGALTCAFDPVSRQCREEE